MRRRRHTGRLRRWNVSSRPRGREGHQDGVWEAPRGWGWWMQPGVGHQDMAPEDRLSRRRP